MREGVKQCVNKKSITSKLKWAGHVESMEDENLAWIKCPESESEKEARKTENAMEGLR